MNKKALSGVIAVVLLISLSILAVGIISTYVIKSSKSVQLSPEYSCLDLKINEAIKIESACYNSNIKEIKTTIKRNINTDQISSIKFTHIAENKKEAWEVGGSCLNCKLPEQGESKLYNLAPSDFSSGELIISSSSCELDRIKIKEC
jgi:archaellum component FlaF (FlaF/FlaG flagellin family)